MVSSARRKVIYTGTFTTKEAAQDVDAKIKAKYGWTTYLIDETK
ncbi:hypothetical protein MKY37_02360 [Psychrobacillus sp. FSL K6-2836]